MGDDAAAAKVVPLKGRPCAMCGRPALPGFQPFCSQRCADEDLGNWLSGAYRIPDSEDGDEEDGDADR